MPKFVKTQTDSRRPLEPKFDGVFRVVSWNTMGNDCVGNKGKDEEVVDHIINEVTRYNANVICLQELTGKSFEDLETRLKNINPSWTCFFDWKQISKDQNPSHYWLYLLGLSICVLGRGSNFKSINFKTPGGNREWIDEARRYMQIDYNGKTITNVHTKSSHTWLQIPRLHKKVTSGIIAGDFNHPYPDRPLIDALDGPKVNFYDPGWVQTDDAREWTWQTKYENYKPRKKVDHILAISEPSAHEGEARDYEAGGSDHRLILGSITFAKKEVKPWRKRPITKKPLPKKLSRKMSPKKTIIAKKKTLTRLTTKKKNSKTKVAKKIRRKIRF